MHRLTDISRQIEAASETALAEFKSDLLHSIIKEVKRTHWDQAFSDCSEVVRSSEYGQYRGRGRAVCPL